jgi:hypothetical protein
MNPRGYGLDQTIRAVHFQKIVRPQLSLKAKRKDRSVFLALKYSYDFFKTDLAVILM